MVRKWNVVISYRLWVSTHFPVYLLPLGPPPKPSGVKQQPSYYAHRFCRSGIRSGHSRDGFSLLLNFRGLSLEDPRRQEDLDGWGLGSSGGFFPLTSFGPVWLEHWAPLRPLTRASHVLLMRHGLLIAWWVGNQRGCFRAYFPNKLLKPHDLCWFVVKQVTKASPDCRAQEIRLHLKC